jgi:TldD protein
MRHFANPTCGAVLIKTSDILPPTYNAGMNDALSIATARLLTPSNLSHASLAPLIGEAMHTGADFADLYFEYRVIESWALEDGIVKSGNYAVDTGVGVRVISGEKTGFAYSDEIAAPSIRDAIMAARAVSQGRGSAAKAYIPAAQKISEGRALYDALNPIPTMDDAAKVALLQSLDKRCRAADARVTQVMASIAAEYLVVLVTNSDGTLAADVRPLTRMSVQLVMEANGRKETGRAGGGGRFGMAGFDEARIQQFIDDALRGARINLEAKPAPAGAMSVVLGPGWPGVLLHEAVGHGLEGDFNRKETSAFAGRIGERVASKGVTVVDDGTLPGRRGSLNLDDEGVPSQNTVLIEDGILKGYLQDSHNARLMKTKSTGNGRRESYAALPMPRMTNTYMLAGERDPAEIIASVQDGIYAVNFGGGQVDITNGKFTFSMDEAYRIENGKITYPVKGATLIGNGPDALTRVSMIGNDLGLDAGIGVCGKDGQSVPVGVGQPTLRIDGITVGGTG